MAAVTLGVSLQGVGASVSRQAAAARITAGSLTRHELRCFGAASMARNRPCHNARLKLMVVPKPQVARHAQNFPCTVVAVDDALKLCAFGVSRGRAAGTVVLLGDSHAGNWRAAVQSVAAAKRWRGISLALGGCPYSTSTRVIPEPLRGHCAQRNREVPDWFAQHPDVHIVFVAQISGVQWVVPPGADQFETQVQDYIAAWNALPASVQHIIVIRDTPKAFPWTAKCVERAIARHRPAGQACRMARSAVLDRDPAVVAAERLASPRVQVVNLIDHFCGDRWCYPVVGGALVQKDWNHISSTFTATLGPYLLHDVDRLMRSWRQ